MRNKTHKRSSQPGPHLLWTKRCYSRLLIDNHITEDHPLFMKKFSPVQYVAMVKKAGVESAMVYACCHNGNCYYPTKVGHMHANLKGRDIFGKTIDLLRKAKIVPVAYYTSVFHNHSAKTHPAWRVTAPNGDQHSKRYWWSCPNNDAYRAFTIAQIGEIIAYDVAGIFIDMTFWPLVCVCQSCREKYLKESGREIPAKIDWKDKEWIAFQRFRERSMVSFTREITDSIKSKKDITVTHQTSTIMHGWITSYTLGIAKACDYTSGDFYGGKYQHILGSKILAAASKHQPYEFMTSRCVNLNDHTSMKSEAELTCEAATTLANAGAYFFIDAINPDGTLENNFYERLGSVSKTLKPFTEKIKEHVPAIVADKALYFSTSAFVDNKTTSELMGPTGNPVAEELTGTSIILTRSHIPFRVVTSVQADFSGLNTVIMNNVMYMAKDEKERIRSFVKNGGTLVATGATSLYESDGTTTGDFGLADVFGVSYSGKQAQGFHYLAFTEKHYLVSSPASAPLVQARDAKVIAKICEPFFDPDGKLYASIHSNPPGIITNFAGLAVNQYGRGRCVYLSSPVLSLQQHAQQAFGAWLFGAYAPSAIVRETNAPVSVEITVLKSTIKNTYLICFVNYQKELPNIPVRDVFVKIELPGVKKPTSYTRISDGRRGDFKCKNGVITIDLSYLETIDVIEIEA